MNKGPMGIPESAIPRHLAKDNCNKCFGRGFSGWLENGDVVPCVCVLKATDKLMAREFARRMAEGKLCACGSPVAEGKTRCADCEACVLEEGVDGPCPNCAL